MEFSNTTTEGGLIQEVDRICGSTNNNFSLKAKTARINMALDRFVTVALTEDEDWNFEDTNYTDLPIGVADLVSGQQDYSFASDVLVVTKILVKDSSGLWVPLTEVKPNQPGARDIFEQPTGNSGVPTEYMIIGNSIFLTAIPNYNSTGGLKVFFKRNVSKFVSTDTTKEPGIPSIFHPYLCREASMPFLIEKKLPQQAGVAAQIIIDEDAIKTFIASRNKARPTKIQPVVRSAR